MKDQVREITKVMFTAQELASKIDITSATVYNAISDGYIKSVPFGYQKRIPLPTFYEIYEKGWTNSRRDGYYNVIKTYNGWNPELYIEERDFYSLKEVESMVGVHQKTLKKAAEANYFRIVHHGNKTRVQFSEMLKLLNYGWMWN